MNKIVLAAAAATAALLSTAASAEITWTHNAGGFVGKGDVQVPLGMDNKTLQANAETISFGYHENRSYDVACFRMEEEWDYEPDGFTKKGEPKFKRVKVQVRVDRDFARRDNIQMGVAYDSRNGKKQVTGFNVGRIDLPAITAQCPGGWQVDLEQEGGPIMNLVRDNGQLHANGVVLPTYFATYN